MRVLRTGKTNSTKTGVFHETLHRFHHFRLSVYDTRRGRKYQPACAAPYFKTNNSKPPQGTLPAPWNPIAIFAIDFRGSLNTLNKNKRKVVPHMKSSQRDTQLYVANSYDQSQHFHIISSNLSILEQKEQPTTNTYYPSKKKTKWYNKMPNFRANSN